MEHHQGSSRRSPIYSTSEEEDSGQSVTGSEEGPDEPMMEEDDNRPRETVLVRSEKFDEDRCRIMTAKIHLTK